ncbi:hypothetical protein I553_1055 [Mycobacterium xenopi 4042]|uniref:Uncharacterized protein n=1 Tax=Mycobacterium xenopi 4042 TaxID=1299334 RepID=X7ZBV8_MYCXE|nr:hypothetical protein I553_1055 [Mycobacterium xenopi 4042]EUA42929.1 hypothetical protein I552_7670 [Mycobacterium xenopi 3993]
MRLTRSPTTTAQIKIANTNSPFLQQLFKSNTAHTRKEPFTLQTMA